MTCTKCHRCCSREARFAPTSTPCRSPDLAAHRTPGFGWARTLAEALVQRDITVLSGLAEGIDAAAHPAALEAGGRTVAVIGTGINLAHPGGNRQLQERIGREGLIISQFWPDAPPTRQPFPMRNAVMSAYGRATVVVEAGEQSGARIQARLAVAHGRPAILTDAVVHGTKWVMPW